ncbi:MAG: hypothetical protein ACXU9L_09685 [Thermodesulfobacteriota bacterium]
MIPISFWCDARKRSASLEVDGFVSAKWENGEMTTKILRIPIPFSLKKEKIRLFGIPPARWSYVKGVFSFLTEWKIKKVEGTLSLPDPMMNGIFYGWMSVIQTREPDRKVAVTINFLGENWLKGEFTVSLKTLFHHFRSWIYPLIREMRGKKVSKGGE